MSDQNEYQISQVEARAVERSPLDLIYSPEEKTPVVTVSNFPALGQLVAMRFLEWAQDNPGGVISLPTGKTPEHFINWVHRLLETWTKPETQALLKEHGVDGSRKPDLSSLHFVQIDEFYPIQPTQKNSFYHYVKKFYIDGFGLDPKKALLMNCNEIGLKPGQTLKDVWPTSQVDLSLRTRQAVTELERTQQTVLAQIDDWCLQRENKIRELGGIGFFLGGIGPDGHIAFNIRGSDHYSTTRLMATNYETQAAAAGDLGGIEVARQRLVITIGLGTITARPDCTAIIIAAGEAKAKNVAAAIQDEKSVTHPASSLRGLPNARFYITLGAAKHLKRRQIHLLEQEEEISDQEVERAIVDLSVAAKKPIKSLTEAEAFAFPRLATILKKRPESFRQLADAAHDSLVEKIERGSEGLTDTRFLHTEPHHDDLMLGLLPAIVRNMRTFHNDHYFVTLTSGFTAVTNEFMLKRLEGLKRWISTPQFDKLNSQNYFDADDDLAKNRDIWLYLDGIAAKDEEIQEEGAARRLLRNMMDVYEESQVEAIQERMIELVHYFSTVYPGRKDKEEIQCLKGMCREWEAETLWGYFGWSSSHIKHLRLGFYTGDIFVPEPTMSRDVPPVVDLLKEVRPDLISVALDPEASGPDTHYKVLQAISDATDRHVAEDDHEIKIWGYRNVWYRFHPCEANVYVPVSLNMLSIMESAFLNTFVSQKEASFPSHEHDGPFCELAQKIQVEQYQMLKTCLGRTWFNEHPDAMIRASRGFVFLSEMNMEEFRQTARTLKQAAEDM
jgi:glucosamine-6-phosphate deaminase